MFRYAMIAAYATFVLLLFVMDRKRTPMSSKALWLPLLWILIISSKPISIWFNVGKQMETPDDYLDGSPVDRAVYLLLIVLASTVLIRRKVAWREVILSNKFVFVFFVYCGLSTLWSDYPLVSMKRWIKDFGNLVMVLIVLTEERPARAVRAVLGRFGYIAVPLSVMVIKYYPDIGRYYLRWTWEVAYSGIALEKNSLGPIAFIAGVFLVWELVETKWAADSDRRVSVLVTRFILLGMVLWLIRTADSSTSTVCMIIGVSLVWLMEKPFVRRQIRFGGIYLVGLAALVIALYAVPGVMGGIVEIVGRDMTFTGRTDLWADLLKVPINFIFGTGYQSFWLGPRAEAMWELYYWHPNQAHNGFLEVYLNSGILGLILLLLMLLSVGRQIRREILDGKGYAVLRLALFVIVLFSNWTEATFSKLGLMWFVMLLSCATVHEEEDTPALSKVLHKGTPLAVVP